SLFTTCERSHGTKLFTTALYHVTSCDQSQLFRVILNGCRRDLCVRS
ncbi:unnamed protein product, partial [Staurois parvus]